MKFVKQIMFIPPPYGGVSVYVKRLTDRLNDEGFVTGAYYFEGEANENIINSPLYDPFQWLSTKRVISRFIKLIKETKNYKIVHSHFGLEGLVFIWGLSAICKKKIVVTIHNSWIENTYASTNVINRFFMKLIVRRDISWIAVSEEAKNKMNKLPVKFKNIRVIPAFIPNNSSINEKEVLDENLITFLSSNKQVIIFYGHNFELINGCDVYGYRSAIEMFGLLSQKTQQNISLVMCIGENNQKEIINLKNLAKVKGLSHMIYWQIGAIKDMNALWKYAKIYIRPTSSDGDSLAVREALALGISVIASDVCMRPKGTIVYHHNNLIDFSNKVMDALLSDTNERITSDYYNEILAVYKKLFNDK